jgi:hypothetical protein
MHIEYIMFRYINSYVEKVKKRKVEHLQETM